MHFKFIKNQVYLMFDLVKDHLDHEEHHLNQILRELIQSLNKVYLKLKYLHYIFLIYLNVLADYFVYLIIYQ